MAIQHYSLDWFPRTCTSTEVYFHQKCKKQHVNQNNPIRSDGKCDGHFHADQLYIRIVSVKNSTFRVLVLYYGMFDKGPKQLFRRHYTVTKEQLELGQQKEETPEKLASTHLVFLNWQIHQFFQNFLAAQIQERKSQSFDSMIDAEGYLEQIPIQRKYQVINGHSTITYRVISITLDEILIDQTSLINTLLGNILGPLISPFIQTSEPSIATTLNTIEHFPTDILLLILSYTDPKQVSHFYKHRLFDQLERTDTTLQFTEDQITQVNVRIARYCATRPPTKPQPNVDTLGIDGF